jgi:hypothetical protein
VNEGVNSPPRNQSSPLGAKFTNRGKFMFFKTGFRTRFFFRLMIDYVCRLSDVDSLLLDNHFTLKHKMFAIYRYTPVYMYVNNSIAMFKALET